MGEKIRVVKTNIGYWLIDITDLFNFFSKGWIENSEDLLKYRKNHKDENWEFGNNFPEDEKKILEEVIL